MQGLDGPCRDSTGFGAGEGGKGAGAAEHLVHLVGVLLLFGDKPAGVLLEEHGAALHQLQ